MTRPDPLHYGWWLASRASGVVAILLVTCSVLLGLAMASGLLRRPGLKRSLRSYHEQLALTGLVAIGVHGATLLGDPWLRPGIAGVLVPFRMAYQPFFTGLGILAGYGVAILGLSFYARRRIGARRWRSIHRATSVVWAMGVIHALGAGTDAGSRWFQIVIAASVAPVMALLAVRVIRGRRPVRPAVAPRSRPLPAATVPALADGAPAASVTTPAARRSAARRATRSRAAAEGALP